MTSVLIVDDNIDLRTIFEWVFQQHGFEIHTASDGKQAIDHLRHNAPDVIILDINMPEVSGLEVASMVRSSRMHDNTRIIFVTGNHMHHTSPEVQLADLFLVKPVEIHDLVTLTQRSLMLPRAIAS